MDSLFFFWRLIYFLGLASSFHSFLLSFLVTWCNSNSPHLSLPLRLSLLHLLLLVLLRSHFTSTPTDISVYTVELASAMGNHTRTLQCRWELDPGLGRFLSFFFLSGHPTCEKCDYTTVIPGPWPCRRRRDMSCHD